MRRKATGFALKSKRCKDLLCKRKYLLSMPLIIDRTPDRVRASGTIYRYGACGDSEGGISDGSDCSNDFFECFLVHFPEKFYRDMDIFRVHQSETSFTAADCSLRSRKVVLYFTR